LNLLAAKNNKHSLQVKHCCFGRQLNGNVVIRTTKIKVIKMTKEEWRQLVKEIYYQSIEPKFRRHMKHFHPFELYERYPYDVQRIIKALRVIRFINENFDDEDDLTNAFTKEYLESVFNDLENGISLNNRLILDTEIVPIIEEFFDEICSLMEADDLPEQDYEALRQSGSRDPKSEIQLSILKIKHKREIIVKRNKERSLYYRVKESKEIVKEKKSRIKESNSNQPPKRKIFKGIGSIAKGTLLTTVDATLIAGVWSLPLSTETTSVGAVVSITTGLGDIFNGVGEIRGE
jgi:hypothetical protein